VGKPLPHTQIRVTANGELEARGAVMSGYLGEEPIGSSKAKDGNWFHTGDLGTIDEDGFVFITGRSKNLFITSYGRNVNPEWVESELTQQPAISQVLLYGEGCDHNLALIWPRFAAATDDIQQLINKSNEHLPDYARVHEFILMEDELDQTLTTSNGRLKRADVINQYQSFIDAHYSSKNFPASKHSVHEGSI
jgi:long-subunit acyl-CoA synthetase (AMP-forming)